MSAGKQKILNEIKGKVMQQYKCNINEMIITREK